MGELRRRAVHALGALVPGVYLLDDAAGTALLSWGDVRTGVVALTALTFLLEALRLSGRLDWAVFDRLTREYEQDNLAGYALYAVGMTAAVLLFRPAIAVPAALMLALGDPIGGVLSAGQVAKRGWVLGVVFVVCFLLAVPFISAPVAAAGAAVAAVADGAKPVVRGYVIDDNLTIPVGAGAGMALVASL
jgi:dolichol kinase